MKFLIISLIFVSCTNLRPKPSLHFKPEIAKRIKGEETLSQSEIENDLYFLSYALRNAYAGYFFKNSESIEEGIVKAAKIKGPISVKEFCNQLALSFNHVRDKHLTFQLRRDKCKRDYPSGKVGQRLFSKKNKVWTVDQISKAGRKVLVITISRFASSSSNAWEGFLEKVKVSLKTSQAVFIDMRGNGGGDDTYGHKLADLLVGEKNIVSPYGTQYKVTTRAGLENRANFYHLYLRNRKNMTEKQIAFWEDLIREEREYYWNQPNKMSVRYANTHPVKKYISKRPIYIIMDRACGSSCESTIDFFEFISPVYRVGENTAGYIHFGNLGFSMLPETNIQVNLASTFNTYRDGRFVEAIGIEPDIKVRPGSDAFEAALNHYVRQN